MNDSERRREQLLRETRKRYSDSCLPPAVHPRYRQAWRSIQPENAGESRGSFGLRLFAALLLFVLFVSAGNRETAIWDIPTAELASRIQTDLDFSRIPVPDLF